MKLRKPWSPGLIAVLALTGCSGEDVVTHSELQSIRPGMPLAQAERAIGHKGDSALCGGLDGAFVPEPDEVVYCWRNSNGSSVSIATLNGRVIAMSETGLRRQ